MVWSVAKWWNQSVEIVWDLPVDEVRVLHEEAVRQDAGTTV